MTSLGKYPDPASQIICLSQEHHVSDQEVTDALSTYNEPCSNFPQRIPYDVLLVYSWTSYQLEGSVYPSNGRGIEGSQISGILTPSLRLCSLQRNVSSDNCILSLCLTIQAHDLR